MNKGNYKSVEQFIKERKLELAKTQYRCLSKTLKDIAKNIDSIIVRQQTKINELNEEKFK